MKNRPGLSVISLSAAALSLFLLGGCNRSGSDSDAANSTSNSAEPASAGNVATGKDDKTPKVQHFDNSIEMYEGRLKDNYVDFSFDFPFAWEYKGEGGKPENRNFIRVENSLKDAKKGEFTLENFAVGALKLKTAQARTPQNLGTAAMLYSKNLAMKWPAYREVSRGPVKINNYPGYEVRYQMSHPGTKRGEVTIFGRIILLPAPKGLNGVLLLMSASSLAKDIKSAADVGVQGELPVILTSFKFTDKKDKKDP